MGFPEGAESRAGGEWDLIVCATCSSSCGASRLCSCGVTCLYSCSVICSCSCGVTCSRSWAETDRRWLPVSLSQTLQPKAGAIRSRTHRKGAHQEEGRTPGDASFKMIRLPPALCRGPPHWNHLGGLEKPHPRA